MTSCHLSSSPCLVPIFSSGHSRKENDTLPWAFYTDEHHNALNLTNVLKHSLKSLKVGPALLALYLKKVWFRLSSDLVKVTEIFLLFIYHSAVRSYLSSYMNHIHFNCGCLFSLWMLYHRQSTVFFYFFFKYPTQNNTHNRYPGWQI